MSTFHATLIDLRDSSVTASTIFQAPTFLAASMRLKRELGVTGGRFNKVPNDSGATFYPTAQGEFHAMRLEPLKPMTPAQVEAHL